MTIPDLISKYLDGATLPARAIEGLTASDLDATPVPGSWSIRQIILHLMDSDLIASDRMKRIIAEDNPTLIYCDESAAARNLPCAQLDLQLACQIFEKNRLMTAQILRLIPEEAFSRRGVHNKMGEISLRQAVELYVNHVPHHLKFVLLKRQMLGKPLTSDVFPDL